MGAELMQKAGEMDEAGDGGGRGRKPHPGASVPPTTDSALDGAQAQPHWRLPALLQKPSRRRWVCRSGGSREDGGVTSDGGLRSLQRPFAPAGAPTEAVAATMGV